jgi:glycosyltransferase involved in cell wall biosynthesis
MDEIAGNEQHSLGTVSILMTSYNKAPYIEQVFNLVRGFMAHGAEVVIVDDGSTDGSLEALREFSQIHQEIVFLSQKNQGSAASRNQALALASREFIVFLDFDDKIDFEVLQSALILMSTYKPDMGVLNYEILPNGGRCEMPYEVSTPTVIRASAFRDSLFKSLGYWRYIYSRSYALQNGLQFTPKFSEVGGFFILDDLFWVLHNCSLDSKILCFPSSEVLYSYDQGINRPTDWLRYQNQIKLFPKAALIFLDYIDSCTHFHDDRWLITNINRTVRAHLKYLTFLQLLQTSRQYLQFSKEIRARLEFSSTREEVGAYYSIFVRSVKNSLLKVDALRRVANIRTKRFAS